MNKLRIGSRKSMLAMLQCEMVRKQLFDIGIETEIVGITTVGDSDLKNPLYKTKSTGIFVTEIEEYLRNKKIDIAVHSLKDLTDINSNGLVVSAILRRENPVDVFVSKKYSSLEMVKSGDVVGTSSARRISELMSLRKDLKIKNIRGNIETRIKKICSGEYDCGIMAFAGIKRLGLLSEVKEILSLKDFTPVRGQGMIAVETRKSDEELNKILKEIDDSQTRKCFNVELAFSNIVSGGCSSPVGVCCISENGSYTIYAYIGDIKGEMFIKRSIVKDDVSDEDGIRLANEILESGGGEILEKIRKEKSDTYNHIQ
jgi:hydroxymethylbilane synthase